MPIILYVLGALVLMLVVWRALWLKKYRYVGFGWALEWKDGHMVVVSRLTKSPSGEANVRIGTIILEYDGAPVVFKEQIASTTFKKGQSASFRILFEGEERSFTMKARTIQGPIPEYAPFTPPSSQRFDIVYGMSRCNRTGQLYETRRPNKAWQSLRYS